MRQPRNQEATKARIEVRSSRYFPKTYSDPHFYSWPLEFSVLGFAGSPQPMALFLLANKSHRSFFLPSRPYDINSFCSRSYTRGLVNQPVGSRSNDSFY